jgi:hypothetical protein
MDYKFELEETMNEFNSYLNRQYDNMLSATGEYTPVILKVTLSEEDCSKLVKGFEKLDPPKKFSIGNYNFEYLGQYRQEITTSPLVRMNGGMFKINFESNTEKLKRYISKNKFRLTKDLLDIKILKLEKVEGRDVSSMKYMDRLNTFKVKINEDKFLTSDTLCDQDGFIYISTNKPSFIYDNFGIDNVLSVERVGSTFIIK